MYVSAIKKDWYLHFLQRSLNQCCRRFGNLLHLRWFRLLVFQHQLVPRRRHWTVRPLLKWKRYDAQTCGNKWILILFYHLHVLQNFAQYLRVDARVIVIAIKNVKSFILISICYSFKKFIQNMFWFLVAVWRENVLLLWNYNVQYLL